MTLTAVATCTDALGQHAAATVIGSGSDSKRNSDSYSKSNGKSGSGSGSGSGKSKGIGTGTAVGWNRVGGPGGVMQVRLFYKHHLSIVYF